MKVPSPDILGIQQYTLDTAVTDGRPVIYQLLARRPSVGLSSCHVQLFVWTDGEKGSEKKQVTNVRVREKVGLFANRFT